MVMRTLFFCFFLIFVYGCSSKPKESQPISVQAFCVEQHDIPATFQFVGVAKSSHPVEIRARVEGYLDSIDYIEGTIVEPSQKLFQLDPSQFIASLQEAKGELARQEAILWRAKRALERIEPLYKENAASLRDYDNATAQVLTAEADVISAKANVTQAELNLGYTSIISPIKGWSGKAIYREGTLITPSINGLLTQVSVIDPIWVNFSVTDEQLLEGRAEGEAHRLILPDQQNYTVALELSDGSMFPYKGIVNFTSPTLDPETGTMMVRSQFNNPEAVLLPGQFVRAYVSGAYWRDAIVVPQAAVFQGREGMFVFVVNENQTAELRSVQVGSWFETYWIIEQGLEAGEQVVSSGVNKLQNGSKVKIISTEFYHQAKA